MILEAGGFNENYQNAQDYDLWLRIGDNFKIQILKEYLGSNCEREGNITSKPYIRRIKNIVMILIRNKKNINILLGIGKCLVILVTLKSSIK